jgi:NDP-sugar pyrophosphorylase family protein
MKTEVLSAGRPESCAPLTCTRDLDDCPVGNRRLRDVQLGRLAAAGLTPGAGLGEGLFWRGQAWLSEALLAVMAVRQGPWVVRDAQGGTLAWSGPRAGAEDQAPVIPADADSFLIRYPWDLLRVNELLLAGIGASRIEGDVSPAAQVEGTLILGAGSRLLPGVYVEGTVVIGAGCKIGPNCYLRGSTSIGDGCHVGQSVEVKNSILMKGASIGHLSYCGDSIIGEKVNFGAGTITANFRHDGKTHRSMVGGALVDTGRRKFGAIMGDHVHTGIHTAIYPGRKLWAGVMTLPGAVVQKDLVSNAAS